MVSFKHGDHYIGVDVGTGSARACVIDHTGNIVGLASQDIKTWQPRPEFYEQSTANIWDSICTAVKQAVQQCGVPRSNIRGLAFDATCSLAVFSEDTDSPVSVSGSDSSNDRNVILWLDHRAVEETKTINATGHPVLQYVGGGMSVEMEMPKILWLKKHMDASLFQNCKFYDLADALTHLATGKESRSYCSVICKQGYLVSGTDRGEEGWQLDFLTSIGLEDLAADNFARLGGINGKNGVYLSAGECMGPLGGKAAAELGLSPGIAVGSGVIDAYAGWIGTVGAKADLGLPDETNHKEHVSQRLAVVAGTSTCHLAMSDDELFVPGVWGPYRDVLFPGAYLAEGGQSATGELIRHVVESHPAYSAAKSAAEQAGVHIYSFLNEYLRQEAKQAQVAHVAQLAKHFFFYGDLWGNRSPIADPQMSGTIIGLRSDQSLKSLALHYYGVLEFIALQTRQIVDTMNKHGHHISTVFMSGSQTQNDILSKDLWGIMDQMSKPGRRVDPTADADEQRLLQAKYEVFLDMCFKQREYRELVDRRLNGAA
ncbi:FGGY-family carbohydrate kinase [Aspergillus stella-maris]|uniref:FGGY-family carbohydrate kinase n=1 Tax=Aspergillus stella-maris TaxID=1810926 RepID=UPI003CCE3796